MNKLCHVATLIALLMPTLPMSAQVTLQQGSVKVNGVNALISSTASLINYGTIIHQGSLLIEKDLLNYGNYEATTSTIVLRGRNQRIVSDTLIIARLRVAGGGIKSLEGTVEVSNQLHLEQGLLRVDNRHRLALAGLATIIQSNEDSYVWGGVSHRGTGHKFFPVGTQGEYAPLTLTNVRGDRPLVQVQYVSTANRPAWLQTSLSGSYEGSPVTVTFLSQNPDHKFYPEQLRITAGNSPDQTRTIFDSGLPQLNLPSITLSSASPTALPWISVGFTFNESEEEVYIPNAFSSEAPNPEDRVIKVYGRYLSHNNFSFGIQDSWGRWLYQTTSLEEASTKGWTTLGSSPAQFRYVVSGQFLSGNSFLHSDTIIKF